MKEYNLLVDEEYQNERIDKYISDVLADFSRSYIQKLISEGSVLLNNSKIKASSKVNEGDNVKVVTPDSIIPDIVAENIPLDILYEDEDVLVIDKPKDMVVHPAPGHYTGTVVNGVMYHCHDLSGINGVLRPGIVHRIDKDTSGSLIICKNDFSHECIAAQLQEHSINRIYLAVVEGELSDDKGRIDKPIGRSQNDRKKMCVNVPNGKRAVTNYEVIERFKGYTYVRCKLETGRTHQIRVHMASIGHPIVGDEVYNSKKPPINTNGQCLHAYILGFNHPVTKEYIETNAPIPEYFEKLLSLLRNKSNTNKNM